ncbi:hypothetical protein G6F66_014770 [Rhizopus arrhizus]|nr:hypothetical protein G6F66_014770 [Rhizopus arrhizus]
MQRFGAKLSAFEDSLARWPYVSDLCRNHGAFAGTNYLTPPVGTHPYGVEGYKPIAQEILDACGAPTDIIVPTAPDASRACRACTRSSPTPGCRAPAPKALRAARGGA